MKKSDSNSEYESNADELNQHDANDDGWFGGFTASLSRIKDSIPPNTKNAIEGIADAIQRSASALAAEFAQLEIDAEWDSNRQLSDNAAREELDEGSYSSIPMPWSVLVNSELASCNDGKVEGGRDPDCAPVYNDDEKLKVKIIALSLKEDTFCGPFVDHASCMDANDATNNDTVNFDLATHLRIIRRLLRIDKNLLKAYDRMLQESNLKEITFWRNYFHHCSELKVLHEHEMLQSVKKIESKSLTRDDQDADLEVLDNHIDDSKPKEECPRTFSMGEFVLVGNDSDDLENLAASIAQDQAINF